MRNNLPTDDPEALVHYLKGRDAFNEYLRTGSSADLELAEQRFDEAEKIDPVFQLAIFYHALTLNELRDHDTAIAKLEALTFDNDLRDPDQPRPAFLAQIYLNLAYAYTKQYKDESFEQAEKMLALAGQNAQSKDLKLMVQAYRVFLCSVMGGHLTKGDREAYLRRAVCEGLEMLESHDVKRSAYRVTLLHEIHNALGIAYMRQGERGAESDTSQGKLWNQAACHFDLALQLVPHSVRVLQNKGLLLMQRGLSRGRPNHEILRQAVRLFEQSLQINPRDQYPHYRLAQLHARLGGWETARSYYKSGRREKGSVDNARWTRLREAIDFENSDLLGEN